MNLCAAILRALEIEGEYDRHVFINSADEWVYWFGETVPEYLVRPVADLDRDTIEAYVDQWIADSQKRKESPTISDTASYYADQIVDHVIPEAAADGDLPEMPTDNSDKHPSPVNSEPGKALLAWLDGHGAPTHARFVALVLLLHRNTKTGHSWPSQSTIGGYSGLSVRSVMRAIQWLESEKVIERVKPHQHGGNRYASVVYRFTKKVPI